MTGKARDARVVPREGKGGDGACRRAACVSPCPWGDHEEARAPCPPSAQVILSRSPLLQPPLRRARDGRDGVILVICRSKLPREGAMATEKATPGAPTTRCGQTPVRGLARVRIYPRIRETRDYCFENVKKSGNSLFRSPQRCLIFPLHRLACLRRPRGAAEHPSGSERGAKRLASALAEPSRPAQPLGAPHRGQ